MLILHLENASTQVPKTLYNSTLQFLLYWYFFGDQIRQKTHKLFVLFCSYWRAVIWMCNRKYIWFCKMFTWYIVRFLQCFFWKFSIDVTKSPFFGVKKLIYRDASLWLKKFEPKNFRFYWKHIFFEHFLFRSCSNNNIEVIGIIILQNV